MSKSAVFSPILRGSHGTFVGTTPIEGVRRLTARPDSGWSWWSDAP